MSGGKKRLEYKVTENGLRIIDQMVKDTKSENRAELIRKALKQYALKNEGKPAVEDKTTSIFFDVTDEAFKIINELVKAGGFKNSGELIAHCLAEYKP